MMGCRNLASEDSVKHDRRSLVRLRADWTISRDFDVRRTQALLINISSSGVLTEPVNTEHVLLIHYVMIWLSNSSRELGHYLHK